MSIILKRGNLLQAHAEAIVNTVNCVGVMGKGIALQFKQKWPENFKVYAQACKNNEIKIGKIFAFKIHNSNQKPFYIINFPTKKHWREKSALSFIDEGLKDLVRFVKLNNISSIAIPPLGCGNGGLRWDEVKTLILKYFNVLQHQVDIYIYEPQSSQILKAQDMEINTERPKLTRGRSTLIKLITIYKMLNYPLSKIEIQKLCYFLQQAGEPLKLHFQKNQYGPYADNLRHVLNILNGHYIEGVGDHDTLETQIILKPGALEEAEIVLQQYPESTQRINAVAQLIEGFETPYGLELLATVHWAAVHDSKSISLSDVIQAIYTWELTKPQWNERKKKIMSEHHISVALNKLISMKWINKKAVD